MTDGPGDREQPPPGWSPQQPPAYGAPGPWADPNAPGSYPPPGGYPPPPPPPPGGHYGGGHYGGGYYGAPVLKPGIIPLRPLQMSDMYNGAVSFIRANPKATLGLSALVVTVAEIITLAIQLPMFGAVADIALITPEAAEADPEAVLGPVFAFLGSALLGGVVTAVAMVVLTGMLTGIIGRSVFGEQISIGQAWDIVKGRILPLVALALLQALIVFGVFLVPVFLVALLGAAGLPTGAVVLLALVLFTGGVCLAVFLYTKLSLAGPAIVLEGIGVGTAMSRSFRLVKGDFWRVFGILLLTAVVVGLVAAAVSAPFSLLTSFGDPAASVSTAEFYVGAVLAGVGAIIAGTITNPFSAGVTTLLYADRRMRAEAFDLVLQTEAVERQQGAPGTAPENLWRPRNPWS
ncbi:hypothetical protein [Herbidospora sp. NBRC 101105]|uniref:glycerophosphoryl diester phosphodiesterase membrane domain-containing protein n=1 Tax=Herbidospora sp. NBRC 101105 TaxID=3032195 RepID=UPI0024A14725|nr:hypothetical protein [Herbidospora sp. NBRC 101105]GLX98486.1 hypothetical protein Hesp01_64360 [Herbidospora sp. NBRC 101105]